MSFNKSLLLVIIPIITIFLTLIFYGSLFEYYNAAYGKRATVTSSLPTLTEPNLIVELYSQGLKVPVAMSFIDKDDILVTQQDGTVIRVTDEGKDMEPILKVNSQKKDERGLLGITIFNDELNNKRFVYLYYSEKGQEKGEVLGNRVYRYELIDNSSLVNPKLILDLPILPTESHIGGILTIGPDDNLYITMGDLISSEYYREPHQYKTQAQNYKNGTAADGRAGILRVTPNGEPVGDGILGDQYPLNLYYAYGIKNSFGIDFDPVTGKLWDTENGPTFGDEINLVEPSFNSGWHNIQGIWILNETADRIGIASDNPDDLVDFNGTGKYSPPEFTWKRTVAPTALTFLTSDKLGKQYENDLFVGDIKFGDLYHFKLNDNRTALVLEGSLSDKISDKRKELNDVTFGEGFGGIVDLEVGPDGYFYILVYDKVDGRIYRILPK